MPFLDDLRNPIEKIILNSPLHGLLSNDLALISFTDHHTGKRLSFSVEYQKENRFIRVICHRKEKCWKKFTFGSPVKIMIRGKNFQGWAEIIDDPEEMMKEWKALLKNKFILAKDFGFKRDESGEFVFTDLPEGLQDYAVLRIDTSGSR